MYIGKLGMKHMPHEPTAIITANVNMSRVKRKNGLPKKPAGQRKEAELAYRLKNIGD